MEKAAVEGVPVSPDPKTERWLVSLGAFFAAVAVVWALSILSTARELGSSEDSLDFLWVPGAIFAAFNVLAIAVLPNAYMAWRLRRRLPAVAAIAAASALAIIAFAIFHREGLIPGTFRP